MTENDSAFIFRDLSGKARSVHGDPDSVQAIEMIFVRMEALESAFRNVKELLAQIKARIPPEVPR